MKFNTFALIILILVSGFLVTGRTQNFSWEVITTMNDITAASYKNDSLFAASTGGLIIYSMADQNYESWNAGNGLSDHHFTALELSDKGTIILGTQSGILAFFDRKDKTFYEDYSLEGNEIVDIHSVADTLWVTSPQMISVFLFEKDQEKFQFRDFYNNFDISFDQFHEAEYYKGHIYIASNAGLLYAPGNFLRFNLKSADAWKQLTSSDGLPSNQIYSLTQTDNTLLIGTANGLSKYDLENFANITNGLGGKTVRDILIHDNQILVDNSAAIYRLEDSNFVPINQYAPRKINDFFVDSEGQLWGAVIEKGIYNLESGDKIWFNGPVDNALGEVLLDSRGRLWVVSGAYKDERGKGFSVLQTNGEWLNIRHLGSWRSTASAQTIMEDTGGNIWIGSWNGGLTIINPSFDFFHFNNYTTTGNVWISSTTRDDTVTYSPPDSVRHFLSYTRNYPELLVITDIMLDNVRNNIWLLGLTVQSGQPIIRYNGTTFSTNAFQQNSWNATSYPSNFTITNDQVTCLTMDIFDNLWIGTENSGVVVMQITDTGDTTWQWITESDNLKSPKCWAIAADEDGYVWLGTHGGLNAYFNGQIFDFRENYQPIGLRINYIFVDSENNKWFATDAGLSLLKASGSPWDPASWIHFVPQNSELFGANTFHTNLPSEEIRSVFVDDQTGDVYCGTYSGLAILRSNPFTTPLQNYDKVEAGPIPLQLGGSSNNIFYIRNLTGNSQVKILTATGRLVRTLEGSGQNEILGSVAQWDGRNEQGRLVSSGVYLYLVTDEDGNSASGKFLVIRE